jgi:phosphatidylglycerophosphate synthase
MSEENRRPIKARSVTVMKALAARIAKSQITPNQISVLSIFVSLLVPLGLQLWGPESLWGALVAITGIQLRLVCNLIDGMVAIEGTKKSALGDIYNEFPDRISDTIIILGIAYSWSDLQIVGWAASFFSILTAYTRVLGAASGTAHFFCGPMAKQHRMALLSFILLICPWTHLVQISPQTLVRGALLGICIGAAITTARRLWLIKIQLQKKLI